MSAMTDKLSTIRQLLQSHQYDYYLVPSADAHNNEYTPEKWQRRAYISGFDGSAGEALIGTDEAHLWT
ncbi:aminopeptidase P family N-terminal domain-containing protein, partial [Fangia hongkongensis]